MTSHECPGCGAEAPEDRDDFEPDNVPTNHQPEIRISGPGGAALVIQPVPAYERTDYWEVERIGINITLIDPERWVTFPRRFIGADTLPNLADFLSRAVVMEIAVPLEPFEAPSAGVTVSAPACDDSLVNLRVSVVRYQDGPLDLDEVDFMVTRVALWHAAEAAKTAADRCAGAFAGPASAGE